MNELFSQGGKGSTGILTNKQAIARKFGVKQNEVVYFAVGVDLGGYKVIYDKSTQRAYSLPVLPAETTAVSLNEHAVLVHSAGTVDLGELAATRREFVCLSDSFATDLVVNTRNEVLFHNGIGYTYLGSLPVTISAGINPVGNADWKPQTGPNLQNDLRQVSAYFKEVSEISTTNISTIYDTVCVGVRYVYSRSTGAVDGITKIASADGAVWELTSATGVYASDFCTDTPSLMKAYTASAALACDFIMDKNMTGLIASTDDPVNPGNNAFKSVICCVSNSTIRFVGDGALRLANQGRPQSHIIYAANGVQNVNIYNPVLEGDRLTNTTIGEHGWGLTILQSYNIRVIGGTFTNMFGDGIYIGMKWGTTDGTVPGNIYIEKPVIRQCRRNGISLTSGENVLIVNPEIYDIGDYGGVTGAMPKSGIDIEPEADESVPGYTVPRLINCEISNPYINGAYTGLELNIFPNGLIADVNISGNTTLTNVTNRGVTATRVNGNGIGKILIDRVVFKTRSNDFCVFEMLGNDRLFVEIGEIADETTTAGGDRYIRLLPRTADPVGQGLPQNFSNISVGKCSSKISTFTLLAGVSLEQYSLDINIGQKNDPIATSLSYAPGDTGPAQMRGFIGGVYTTTDTAGIKSKLYNSTIRCNTLAQAGNITVDTTGDFRELTVSKFLNSDVVNSVYVSGLNTPSGASMHSSDFSARLTFKNNEGTFSEIISSYGTWTV